MSAEYAPGIPMLFYWRGKNVEELSRDELIAAVKQLGRAYEDSVKLHRASNEIFRTALERRQSWPKRG